MLLRLAPSCERARGGSFMRAPVAIPRITDARPMMMKDKRQPCMPPMLRLARFVPMSVPPMWPMYVVNCMQPKTLPRQLSDVTSATMPLAIGFREASMMPFRARRTTMGVSWSTAARMTVMRPCTTQPFTMSHFLFMTPRSAMTPQRGEARLVASACTRLMRARSFSVRSRSIWSAKKTQGSSTMSAPSSAPTEHSMKSSLQPGNSGGSSARFSPAAATSGLPSSTATPASVASPTAVGVGCLVLSSAAATASGTCASTSVRASITEERGGMAPGPTEQPDGV
mmetsp:Transcript_93808/g.297699  ORF Transcript_93808/g.297699 Transcript_93808/m.297699 type:complete len:283 (+) Transcript_93808:867-1715(+)